MERIISGVAISLLLIGMFVMVWDSAYAKASRDLSSNWYEGAEGYCLADKPAHPGECNQ